MSGNPTKSSSAALQRYSVPIQITDLPLFGGALASMKERFATEMKRIDEEMLKFSKNLLHLSGQTTTVQTGMTSSNREAPSTFWDVITKSPLVQDEGTAKILSLQFDVSQFSPDDISVKIVDNILIVTSEHKETGENHTRHSKFNREFRLPAGTDPEAVECLLSTEGVLTVRAPIHLEPPDSLRLPRAPPPF